MKTLKILALSLTLAFSFQSCSRELDIEQEGSPNLQNFWKTEYDLMTGSNAMYRQLMSGEFYGRGLFWFINASDDMVTGRTRAEADNAKNFNSSYLGGSLENQWFVRYWTIARANDVLHYADQTSASEKVKNKYKGEALFMSSRMYFELASNYGNEKAGVPILPRDGSIAKEPIPRATNVNVNYDMIIEDLKKAGEMLPWLNELSASEKGRPHKVAAWALLSKVYLFKKDYANAEIWATKVMKEGNRQLMANFRDVFKAENNFGSEYIWSANTTPEFTGWGSILAGVMLENRGWGEYNGWGYFTPTKELYDSYEEGDKRREATILKPGDKFIFNNKERVYSTVNSPTEMQFNKYMDAFKVDIKNNPSIVSQNGDFPATNLNIPLMRYAEVILIAAEAKLMQGKNADTEINMIRVRAGLSPKSGNTMTDLKRERRNELAGEWSDRHRDLVRWGDAQAVYAKPLHGWSGNQVWEARNFNPAIHNVWAVPRREVLNSNGIITQNEGW
ncbi:RagB/SusD family nutrient uptake outer membrane protein [Riemerella anatipestifer]|uniref:RagB/SusD family nutrient uptake outer membrane protein n=1 Tax=Riemerella anatipestifer TaxID=34085 RepID=UPI002A8DBD5C|nr:RagB/SusD family nutrient uptake outer membrane protein [Riemerella anatipestifer]MDY3358386.1 RagB/SusD family nutrient uptake outer membrane protein [Riemerella anatipestifer]